MPAYPRAVAVGAGVAGLGVAVDQATKVLAERVLTPGVFVPLLGENVGWQLVYNANAAFGIPAPSWLFPVVVVLVLVLVARALPRATGPAQATAYGLLVAGAIGNVLDRLLRSGDDHFAGGHVVDFVAWGSFPRFNVADSAITIGFVLLVLTVWRGERDDDHPGGAAPPTPEP